MTYDGELHVSRADGLAAELIDVLHPALVVLEVVRREADDLHVALRPLRGPVHRSRLNTDAPAHALR